MKSILENEALDLATIEEETSRDLIRGTWPSIVGRVKSQNITAVFLYSEGDTLHFRTSSGTHPGKKWWHVQIRFKDLARAQELYRTKLFFRKKRAINMLKKGDLLVDCDCHCWNYYCAYVAWKFKYGINQENRPAKKRNPQEDHLICKHVVACLYLLAKTDKWFDEMQVKGKFARSIHIKPTRMYR